MPKRKKPEFKLGERSQLTQEEIDAIMTGNWTPGQVASFERAHESFKYIQAVPTFPPAQLAALAVALEALAMCARGDVWAVAQAERGRFGAAWEVVRGMVENDTAEFQENTEAEHQ